MSALEDEIAINAWTGRDGDNVGRPAANARNWAARPRSAVLPLRLAAPPPVDPAEWRRPEVGWGVVLPENETIEESQRAIAADAPAAIRDLIAARGNAPVLRYRMDSNFQRLRRYYVDRPAQDVEISSAAKRGTAPGALPQYLLICGSPSQIPWEVQFVLSGPCFAGRLDLDDTGLRNYVDALISDFAGSDVAAAERVVWATDHSNADITHLMRHVVAAPIAEKLRQDTDIGSAHLEELLGSSATVGNLESALARRRPALVVTASHGMTGPLNDVGAMQRQLGFLVDNDRALLGPSLLSRWQPAGCIWYAHACCSAGSNAPSQYDGLLDSSSPVATTLTQIAGCGRIVAPFPKALLSAERPARAFIGHVEPTFNWTLRAQSGQVLTQSLVDAVYTRMHQVKPQPVGLSFTDWYREVGQLQSRANAARRSFTNADPTIRANARADANRSELAALDRGSVVILGDPTACLPPLH